MKDLNIEVDLEKYLARFLEKHVSEEEPFIISFSGGPDSSALLYGIAAIAKKRRASVLHIDHGWRKESYDEAKKLEAQVVPLGIPFHSYKLPLAPQGENLEDWSRKERMKCFSKVGARIVFLAHHADDQIEIVLKRFLEGSFIKNFRGMSVVEEQKGLTLMRPFLSFRKSELVSWLEMRKIPYLDDPTNRDPKYLRARFRTELFPLLRDSFGKGFEQSLLRISEEAFYLDEWLQGSLKKSFLYGDGKGLVYAISKEEKTPSFLVQHLVDKLRKKCDLPALSRSQVMGAVSHFLRRSCGGKSFPVGRGVLLVEHDWMGVFAERPFQIFEIHCAQEEGAIDVSCWELSWRKKFYAKLPKTPWQAVFRGVSVAFRIPKKPFVIFRSSDRLLQHVREKDSVPTSLRPFMPTILQEGKIVADLLTGYSVVMPEGFACYEVVIRLKA